MSKASSTPQAAETPLSYADFLAQMTGQFQDIRWGPAYSTGTRVLAQLRSGVWKAYLINDLTSAPLVARTGQGTVSITANNIRGTGNLAISPALTDPIAKYKAFGDIVGATLAAQVMRTVRLVITTASNIAVEIFRNFNSAVLASSLTGVTVAGQDLANVSGMALTPIPNPTTVSDPHGGSSSFFDHLHLNQNHPVTDPQHNHTVASLSSTLGLDTFTIDWVVIHV